MSELFRTARAVGWKRLLRLYRGYRLGWQGIISGFYTTRTVQALFNVGFFDALQNMGTVDVPSFAESENLDAQILQTLADELYALRILKKADAGYSLDSKGKILVEVARGWFEATYGYEDILHCLEPLLRKEVAYGTDVHRRTQSVVRGSGEMERWIHFAMVIETIRRSGYKQVLDLGCGDASFLIDLCRGDETVAGYGIDLAPEAVADAQARVNQAGFESRIHLLVGDICDLPGTVTACLHQISQAKGMAELPEASGVALNGIDVATCFLLLHELLFDGRDRVVGLLRSFRAVFPATPLIVVEVVKATPEELRRRPGMSIQYLVHHDLSHQKLASLEEWRGIFQAAGFRSIEERYLRVVRTAMFTLR